MRKLFFAIAVACIGVFATSCDKNEDGTPIIPTISATIDSQEWVGIAPKGILTGGVLTIASTSLDGKAVTITVNGDKEGTYELNPLLLKTQCGAVYKPSLLNSEEASLISSNGKVIITKFDTNKKRVSGTFEFNLTNSAAAIGQITKGTFSDVSYSTVQ
ncbi:DUF6252 family protein [Acetobacteroides hydrogenigenes]|uniref:Uncharacterized protein n=1 Tax=Acetobacteroides hydrogenigenes TaxID=979970 RepID=A0A4R2EUY0_9BACT|nr:DUF6252 family protein [Acetobacteroides hydrogenigenes]TCN70604.1 hypothetical protein CLV25_103124 [Acetobacteroides hydrogenigenes]